MGILPSLTIAVAYCSFLHSAAIAVAALDLTQDDSISCDSTYDPAILRDPCSEAMKQQSPDVYSISFPTQYGTFIAECVRSRAPVWADRVYNLAKNGYYDENYFFRVIPNKYVQFGTAGNPAVSNIYNWSSTAVPECAILEPQPPDMPFCMSDSGQGQDCTGVPGLDDTFGTLSMSTNYKYTDDYPDGVTWNATAELFINIGNNSRLDANLFVPICEINQAGMKVVLDFPSFGEVSDLGGDGPSLGMLYQEGNEYIEANTSWASMAETSTVQLCENSKDNDSTTSAGRSLIVKSRGFFFNGFGTSCSVGALNWCLGIFLLVLWL